MTNRGSQLTGPESGVSSIVTTVPSSVGIDRQLDPSGAGRSEADLQHDPVERLVLEHLGGVVQLGSGEPDGVMELAAFVRPVGIDAAEATRADDPTRIGVGVVEHLEHCLG